MESHKQDQRITEHMTTSRVSGVLSTSWTGPEMPHFQPFLPDWILRVTKTAFLDIGNPVGVLTAMSSLRVICGVEFSSDICRSWEHYCRGMLGSILSRQETRNKVRRLLRGVTLAR